MDKFGVEYWASENVTLGHLCFLNVWGKEEGDKLLRIKTTLYLHLLLAHVITISVKWNWFNSYQWKLAFLIYEIINRKAPTNRSKSHASSHLDSREVSIYCEVENIYWHSCFFSGNSDNPAISVKGNSLTNVKMYVESFFLFKRNNLITKLQSNKCH